MDFGYRGLGEIEGQRTTTWRREADLEGWPTSASLREHQRGREEEPAEPLEVRDSAYGGGFQRRAPLDDGRKANEESGSFTARAKDNKDSTRVRGLANYFGEQHLLTALEYEVHTAEVH